MQSANLYQQYKAQSLETLTKEEIVIKLFEEASKQVNSAIYLIGKEDHVSAYNCIAKAQKVISALNSSLDRKYEISHELEQLYLFILDKLTEANVNRDIPLMKELLGIINELKVTFKTASKLARAGR